MFELAHHASNTSTLRINNGIGIYNRNHTVNTLNTNVPNSHNRKTTQMPLVYDHDLIPRTFPDSEYPARTPPRRHTHNMDGTRRPKQKRRGLSERERIWTGHNVEHKGGRASARERGHGRDTTSNTKEAEPQREREDMDGTRGPKQRRQSLSERERIWTGHNVHNKGGRASARERGYGRDSRSKTKAMKYGFTPARGRLRS